MFSSSPHDQNPQLHESVKNFMTHTCTHVQYDDNGQPIPSTGACTDKTGKCKKGFPQSLQATTTEEVDGYAKYRRDMAADQCVPHYPLPGHMQRDKIAGRQSVNQAHRGNYHGRRI
ncbi:hypothetical protein AaE_001129 [Aphanomyces astaci]|uniref:Uncharacterized protein n=1 Tax=Aphanomyces astaci TaxID=112090 RepID=A0A6A5AJ18_APHAT|nr:hypothetical protein AaE_001129 [Aphanomyces astaci]